MADKLAAPTASTKEDVAHALLKGALGAVPYAGGILAETFGLLLATPFQRRLISFLEKVAERLNDYDVRLEDAVAKEEFVSAVRTAAETVLKTHDEMKRRFLVNAVVNIGIGTGSLTDDVQQIYLQLIDRLTPLHLRVMIAFQLPKNFFEMTATKHDSLKNVTYSDVVAIAVPELDGKNELIGLLCRDLYYAGLFDEQYMDKHLSTAARESRITSFGNDFLRFITDDL